ncbi:MAG: hypothetical protein Q9217_006500 [Psora testacea]
MPGIVATQQRSNSPKHRASAGKDILSKMLQMEKQSQQQRASSTSPTLHSSDGIISPNEIVNPSSPMSSACPLSPTSPKKTTAASNSPVRPGQMPRSQTSPVMVGAKAADEPIQVPAPLKIKTESIPPERIESQICLSPSWSDHGEKERRKEKKRQEREQKELEKRQKLEEDGRKATEYRSGKRLSKRPPPAAMDTQKMPAELRSSRRNSLRSLISGRPSSQEGSRRGSGEEKRLSGTSLASFIPGRRSRSEQRRTSNVSSINGETRDSSQGTESRLPVVSPAAPRLPSFRWSSKKSSANISKSASGSGSDVNEEEFLAFAYQLDDSIVKLDSGEIKVQSEKPDNGIVKNDDVKASGVRDRTESAMEATLPALQEQHKSATNVQQIAIPHPDGRLSQVVHSQGGDTAASTGNDRSPIQESGSDLIGAVSDPRHQSSQSRSSPQRPQLHTWPSHDGSSYVHKQRMYQQQRSIAGFEDEQAVHMANEQAAKEELQRVKRGEQRTPSSGTSMTVNQGDSAIPMPTGSNERDVSLPRQKIDSRSGQSASPSRPVSGQQPAQAAPSPLKAVSRAPQGAVDGHQGQQAPKLNRAKESVSTQKRQPSKTDKILGFRRRTKAPPAEIVVPETKVQASAERASASIDPSEIHEPSTRRSRIERMSAQIPFRTRVDSASSQTKPSTYPEAKDAVRGHSRTRTASSQVLNDNLISPIPISTAVRERSSQPLNKENKATRNTPDQRAKSSSELNTKAKQTESPSSMMSQSESDSTPLAGSHSEEIESPTKSAPHVTGNVVYSKTSKDPELVVESMTGDGIVRKTSITKSRSNPQLLTPTTATNSLPPLDFLPQLKHQPLLKATKRSSAQQHPSESTSSVKFQIPTPASPPSTAYKSPLAPNPPDLALMPRSPLRATANLGVPGTGAPTFNRSSTSVTPFVPSKGAIADTLEAKPIAKLFVICCKCKFWHDLPSKLYEAMALPKELHKRDEREAPGSGKAKSPLSNKKAKVAEARLETAVKYIERTHDLATNGVGLIPRRKRMPANDKL